MSNDIDIANQQVVPDYNINESAHPLVYKTKLVRGNGTRDQDKHDLKVKAATPEELGERTAKVIAELTERNVFEQIRELQPGDTDE